MDKNKKEQSGADTEGAWECGEVLPDSSVWFIAYVGEDRMPLRYNVHNKFWVGLDGKVYKPDEVCKWLNDKNF